MATWDDVRAIAAGYAGSEERLGHLPTIRLNDRVFITWRESLGAIAVRCESAMVETLLESPGEVFFTTDHYRGLPWVLIRLDSVDPVELAGMIEGSARIVRAARRRRR